MFYAVTGEGGQTPPFPKGRGHCPLCSESVIAKCGQIKTWHWAHLRGADCDNWSEGLTDWHLDWQEYFPPEQREVTIRKDGERHRADIVSIQNIVIELQHSYLPVAEIQKREAFYPKMCWIFDVREAYHNGRIEFRHKLPGQKTPNFRMDAGRDHWREKRGELLGANFYLRRNAKGHWTFYWKHARVSIAEANKPVFLDIGNPEWLFYLKKIYPIAPVGGLGVWYSKPQLITLWGGNKKAL